MSFKITNVFTNLKSSIGGTAAKFSTVIHPSGIPMPDAPNALQNPFWSKTIPQVQQQIPTGEIQYRLFKPTILDSKLFTWNYTLYKYQDTVKKIASYSLAPLTNYIAFVPKLAIEFILSISKGRQASEDLEQPTILPTIHLPDVDPSSPKVAHSFSVTLRHEIGHGFVHSLDDEKLNDAFKYFGFGFKKGVYDKLFLFEFFLRWNYPMKYLKYRMDKWLCKKGYIPLSEKIIGACLQSDANDWELKGLRDFIRYKFIDEKIATYGSLLNTKWRSWLHPEQIKFLVDNGFTLEDIPTSR